MMNNNSIFVPDWPVSANVKAFASTRKTGVSAPPYDENNLALHVGDNPHHVEKNRAQLVDTVAMPSDPKWLNQTHSNIVIHYNENETNADACFSDKAQQVCVVLTADCLPILVCNEKQGEVAAIHAGWRGLLNNIIENTMMKFTGNPDDTSVWLGPAIGPEHFEVGEDVYALFINESIENASCFQSTRQGKYLANIYALAKQRFIRCGVRKTYGGTFCTFTDKERFYSYRRESHTGRMASLIWLEK